MKIKRLIITILMTMLLIILETTAFASIGKVNSKEVKLRKKPDGTSSILDYVDKDTEVEILEKEDGWYKVKAKTSIGKVTGYIKEEDIDVQEENVQNNSEKTENVEKGESSETIPTDTTTENPPVIAQNNNIEENKQYSLLQDISIKALPLINSRETAKITGNITVIEIINEWARVENDTESGWIRKNILKNSLTAETTPVEEETEKQPEEIPEEPKQEEPKEPEITNLNKTGYVSTDGLMVRKGPSTDTKAIDSLEKNDEVKIVGQTGKWYKIDLNGKEGYVSAKYISDTKIPETTSRGGNTLKNETQKKEETPKQEEIPVETTPTQPETSSTGTAIVEFAKKYLGYKYVSGGASPATGFDCSGFTSYVYKQFGASLYRTSKDQIKNGVAVDKNNLQPGDLVIFNNEANTAIGHVGIYIGDGNFIHASNPKDGVKITTLLSGYYKIRYVGARRVI